MMGDKHGSMIPLELGMVRLLFMDNIQNGRDVRIRRLLVYERKEYRFPFLLAFSFFE